MREPKFVVSRPVAVIPDVPDSSLAVCKEIPGFKMAICFVCTWFFLYGL